MDLRQVFLSVLRGVRFGSGRRERVVLLAWGGSYFWLSGRVCACMGVCVCACACVYVCTCGRQVERGNKGLRILSAPQEHGLVDSAELGKR